MKNPKPSSLAAHNRMVAQRQRDTEAELHVRRILFRKGMRYRVDYPVLHKPLRRADIAFMGVKVAVFIDGCFWHGCPVHGTRAKANAAFWDDKISTNQKRDKDTNNRLKEQGWSVIRIWEHEDPEKAAKKIEKEVRQRRGRKLANDHIAQKLGRR